MVLSHARPRHPAPIRPSPPSADASRRDSAPHRTAPGLTLTRTLTRTLAPAVAAAPLPANLALNDLVCELIRGLRDDPRPLPRSGQALAVAQTLLGLVEPQLLREQAVALKAALVWAQVAHTAVQTPLAHATAQARLLDGEALPPSVRDTTSAMCAGLREADHILGQLQRLTCLREKDWGPGVEPTLDLDEPSVGEPSAVSYQPSAGTGEGARCAWPSTPVRFSS